MEMTVQLTIDCSDPQRMVTFWARPWATCLSLRDRARHVACLLGVDGVPEAELPAGAGDIPESIIDPAGRGPRVWFQQVPEPKVAKNRWHFDLKVGGGRDVPLDVRTTAGQDYGGTAGQSCATVLRIKDEPDMGLYATAMQDPESNEFDVV